MKGKKQSFGDQLAAFVDGENKAYFLAGQLKLNNIQAYFNCPVNVKQI
jgi:hypothetical protein